MTGDAGVPQTTVGQRQHDIVELLMSNDHLYQCYDRDGLYGELDIIANTCAIVKLKKCNKVPFNVQIKSLRRPKFKDIVDFISTRAQVAVRLLFGLVKDNGKGQERVGNLLSSQLQHLSKLSVNPEVKLTKTMHNPINAFTKSRLF